MTALIVGAVLALLVGLMATVVGFDRDRAFYPTVTMVVASYYALFAAMGASTGTPAFCSAYDVTAALYLAWLIRKRQSLA